MLMIPEEEYICTAVSNHAEEIAVSLCNKITQDFKEVGYGE